MMISLFSLRWLRVGCFCGPLCLAGQILIDDDFESSSSAGYIIVDNISVGGQSAPDGSVDFGYNYLADGIPLAPNSTIFGGRGLRMTANETEPGSADFYTVFNTTQVLLEAYLLSVDMYLGVNGSSGTTEYGTIGIGGNGTVINTTAFGPASGSGNFITISGDGGYSDD